MERSLISDCVIKSEWLKIKWFLLLQVKDCGSFFILCSKLTKDICYEICERFQIKWVFVLDLADHVSEINMVRLSSTSARSGSSSS